VNPVFPVPTGTPTPHSQNPSGKHFVPPPTRELWFPEADPHRQSQEEVRRRDIALTFREVSAEGYRPRLWFRAISSASNRSEIGTPTPIGVDSSRRDSHCGHRTIQRPSLRLRTSGWCATRMPPPAMSPSDARRVCPVSGALHWTRDGRDRKVNYGSGPLIPSSSLGPGVRAAAGNPKGGGSTQSRSAACRQGRPVGPRRAGAVETPHIQS
jgi:hypothetical protein